MSSSRHGKNVICDTSENQDVGNGCDQDCSSVGGGNTITEEDKRSSDMEVEDTTAFDNLVDSVEGEIMGMPFSTCEDAENFYNDYARMKGFSIRKQDVVKDKNNSIRQILWVCSRHGFRNAKWLEMNNRTREAKPLTRTGCEASLKVTLDKKTGLFNVSKFISNHNHELAPSAEVHFLRSHRKVSAADQAYAMSLRKAGMKTCQVMNFQVQLHGGHENVGYTKRDLYNRIQEERDRHLVDGDAEGALGYLHGKARVDPGFFCKYDVDGENQLSRLFWSDGRSRADYASFGDVLVFDTTYKTNAYRKPLVILCGVNNHYQTVVFSSALLVHETSSTYEWVLERFLEAMDNKIPISVVTDGCKAMHIAISKYFPNANHRLCSWHLNRNASENIRKTGFGEAFNRLMKRKCDTTEFEDAWTTLVNEFGVGNHKWISETYDRRHMWAEAYLRGMFFANMNSTQRCESMNSFMKKHVNERLRLYEFIEAYDNGLNELRNSEARQKSITDQTNPVLTTDLPLEKQAADLFTRNVYFFFRDELKDIVKLFDAGKVQNHDHITYTIGHYSNSGNDIHVKYFPATQSIECSCIKFEGCGFPCAHMLHVMIAERLRKIPKSCILHRWTRNPITGFGNDRKVNEQSSKQLQMSRFGILSSLCGMVCYYASHSSEMFDEAQGEVIKLSEHMKRKFDDNKVGQSKSTSEPSSMIFDVRDPKVIPARRNIIPKKTPTVRRCKRCGCVGHRRDTCPKKGTTSTHDEIAANMSTNENETNDVVQDCSPCTSSFTRHLMSYGHHADFRQVNSVYGQYPENSAYGQVNNMYEQFPKNSVHGHVNSAYRQYPDNSMNNDTRSF